MVQAGAQLLWVYDRLEVPYRDKRGHVRLTCSLLNAHVLCKGEFKG